jgi:transcriptional regulator with XRE-family HTH domain
MSTLAKLIELRKEKGITQKRISRVLQVTRSTMSRYESGERKISLEDAEEYADFLGYELKLMLR